MEKKSQNTKGFLKYLPSDQKRLIYQILIHKEVTVENMSLAFEKRKLELKRAFEFLDVDKDGAISANDLTCILEDMGERPTQVEIARWIAIFDMSNDHTIGFEEFVSTMLVAMDNLITEDDILDTFRRLDADENGYITVDELIEAMYAEGKHLTYDDAQLMIRQADSNIDGKIEAKELIEMLQVMTKDVLFCFGAMLADGI